MVRASLALSSVLALAGCSQPDTTTPPAAASTGTEAPAAAPAAEAATATAPVPAVTPAQGVLTSFEKFNAHDLDGALANTSFEVSYRVVGGESISGRGHVRKRWEELLAGFPDVKRTVRRVIHAGETVAVQYVVTGKQTAAYQGIAPTSKSIGYEALMVLHLVGSEVTEITVYEDELTLRQQLGALPGPVPQQVPPPASAPEVVEGDGDRALVNFVKAWYAAAPGWNKACDSTHCTADMTISNAATGEEFTTQQARRNYLDSLGAGAKDLVVEDVWVEPAGSFFVTFVTLKNVRPSAVLGMTPAKTPISLSVADVIQLEGGKFKSLTTYFNRQEAQSQLTKK
jgi:predicted ester cyclase